LKISKVLSMLGIAAKSGNIASGEFSTENAVRGGKAFLVVLANDASDNTKKKFQNMCTFYEVPIMIYCEKELLGHCIGKEFRASLAVTNEKLANAVLEKYEAELKTAEVR